jgi:hypothetical protein
MEVCWSSRQVDEGRFILARLEPEILGNLWTITFHGPDFAGHPADLRVLVTRKTNDDYNWSVAEKQGETWKELAHLEYLRVPGE